MSATITSKNSLLVIIWLLFCCIIIFTVIVVGAITRLSESGLSIVEWKPLIGVIPPLHDQEWNRVFDLYKQSPEYIKKNHWMQLNDFKVIFFWEWFHRFLGRLVGLVYALPLFLFWQKNYIPEGFIKPLTGILILGGLQGFMGWYMVKSGLIDEPAVSHYRLAIHLGLALLIYTSIFWTALRLLALRTGTNQSFNPDAALTNHALVALGIMAFTITWGAYTAGLDAGLVYNDSFPMMGDRWLPSELFHYKPMWLNFFENHAVVQFTHRWLAIMTGVAIVTLALHAGYKKRQESCFVMLGAWVFLQIALGIYTLFSQVWLPIAVMHQAGAVILLSLLLFCLHQVHPQTGKIKNIGIST